MSFNDKKAFFIDIDGTIVDAPNGVKEPTIYTQYAFKELCKDNYVFISSGRNMTLMYKYITDLNPSGYVICNGTVCTLNDKVIYEHDMNKDNLKRAIEYCNRHHLIYYRETIDKMYENEKSNIELAKRFRDTWNMTCESFDDNGDLECNIFMVICDNYDEINDFKKEFDLIYDVRKQYGFTSLDVGDFNQNKGTGVKEVIKYLGIDFNNTYSFGDALNDLEMIKAVKHGIVVESGFKELKDIAEEITESPKDDGLYKYLVRHNLIKPM